MPGKEKELSKNIDLWASINKNGFINVSIDEPTRNELKGKWDYKYPFVNSIVYTRIKDIIEHSHLNWESEAEFFTIQY